MAPVPNSVQLGKFSLANKDSGPRSWRVPLAISVASRFAFSEVKREIRDAIRTLLDAPLSGHTLQQELIRFRSFRVRNYRIIYGLNDEDRTIDIVFVGQRRNVYEEWLSLVRRPSLRN